MAKRKSLQEAVSKEIKSKFDLSSFKEKKGLKQNIKFKEQEWIPLSKAFQDVTSIPGIPMGHIVLLRGHSDTGKTTALLEAAVSAQKRKILPIFIITEMKWNWEHAKQMGLEVDEVEDHSENKEDEKSEALEEDHDEEEHKHDQYEHRKLLKDRMELAMYRQDMVKQLDKFKIESSELRKVKQERNQESLMTNRLIKNEVIDISDRME